MPSSQHGADFTAACAQNCIKLLPTQSPTHHRNWEKPVTATRRTPKTIHKQLRRFTFISKSTVPSLTSWYSHSRSSPAEGSTPTLFTCLKNCKCTALCRNCLILEDLWSRNSSSLKHISPSCTLKKKTTPKQIGIK